MANTVASIAKLIAQEMSLKIGAASLIPLPGEDSERHIGTLTRLQVAIGD